MRCFALLAFALVLACGPSLEKAPPPLGTTTDETTGDTDPTSTGTDSFGTTTSVMTSTTMPDPEPLTTSGTSTTTGGDVAPECKPLMCGDAPCIDAENNTICQQCEVVDCDGETCCANTCKVMPCAGGCPGGTACDAETELCTFKGAPVCTALTCSCIVDFDCGDPGSLWCNADGTCVTGSGVPACPGDGGTTTTGEGTSSTGEDPSTGATSAG